MGSCQRVLRNVMVRILLVGDKSADKHDKMYFKANGFRLFHYRQWGNIENYNMKRNSHKFRHHAKNIWTLCVEGMLMSDFGNMPRKFDWCWHQSREISNRGLPWSTLGVCKNIWNLFPGTDMIRFFHTPRNLILANKVLREGHHDIFFVFDKQYAVKL